jgi:hypothetical protein
VIGAEQVQGAPYDEFKCRAKRPFALYEPKVDLVQQFKLLLAQQEFRAKFF